MLTVKDVHDLFGFEEDTIRRWARNGKIPAYKFDIGWMFEREELQEWKLSKKRA